MLIVAELLQEALAPDNATVNGLTASGMAALFAEAWFPSLTPGYGAAGQCWHSVCTVTSNGASYAQTYSSKLTLFPAWMPPGQEQQYIGGTVSVMFCCVSISILA